MSANAQGGQKGAPDALVLKLQEVVSHLMSDGKGSKKSS